MPQSPKPKLAALLSALVLMLIPASCASRTSTAEIDATAVACQIFEPIRFSRLHDTAETIVAIKAHNKIYFDICSPPDH